MAYFSDLSSFSTLLKCGLLNFEKLYILYYIFFVTLLISYLEYLLSITQSYKNFKKKNVNFAQDPSSGYLADVTYKVKK